MPVAPAGLRWHEEADFGVVGAGACGLAAAHAAAGDDLRVIVWERAKEPGGTTALSSGCLAGAGSRLQRAAGVADAATLTHAGAPTSTGDALLWGADAGASSRDLGAYYAYPYATVGANLPVPWDLIRAGAILVNQAGERFMHEMLGPIQAVPALLAQPGRIGYLICDAHTLKAVSTDDPHFAHRIPPRAARRAEDLAGLAAQFQIGAEALLRTVAGYNASRDAGTDAFGRTQFGAAIDAPLFGIRVSPALFTTQGGLVIDTEARVLRPDGAPVPHLYAGGGSGRRPVGPQRRRVSARHRSAVRHRTG